MFKIKFLLAISLLVLACSATAKQQPAYSIYSLTKDSVAPGSPRSMYCGVPSQDIPWPKVDAMVHVKERNALYLFYGLEYARYNTKDKKMLPGYPKIFAKEWIGGPKGDFDAAVRHPNNKLIYFFKGDKYFRYDLKGGKGKFLDNGKPRKIGIDGWKGLKVSLAFEKKGGFVVKRHHVEHAVIDAVLYNENNQKFYFFQNDQYYRFDLHKDRVDTGYPKKIDQDGWFDLQSPIWAAEKFTANDVNFIHPANKVFSGAFGLFNLPLQEEKIIEGPQIHDQLIELLNNAAPESSVFLSVPGWDYAGLATAVKKAKDRGVKIRIIANGYERATQSKDKEWFFIQNNVCKVLFNQACTNINTHSKKDFIRIWNTHSYEGLKERGFSGINHAKFALFKKSGDMSDIVVVSSANFRHRDRTRENSGILLQNNVRAYNYLNKLADAMWRLALPGDDIPLQPVDDRIFGSKRHVGCGISLNVTPLVDKSRTKVSPFMDALEGVQCKRDDKRGSIKVAASTWPERAMAVNNRLVELKKQGCDVRVIGEGIKGETNDAIFQQFKDANIPIGKSTSHNKYMIIDSMYANKKERQRVVIGGSLNLGGTAVTVPSMLEAGFTIENRPDLYADYLNNWFWLCDNLKGHKTTELCKR